MEEVKQIQNICNLEKVRSRFILKKIMNNLKKRISLKMVKYSKKTQKNLNYDINTYKDFSEIKIEVIPESNKFGKFINIINQDEEIYFHIFFNNDDKEIKRTYIEQYEIVSKITIIIDYEVRSFYQLFDDCKCIESIRFIRFERDNITDMSHMFYDCNLLKELDITNFNTSEVISMKYMFYGCSPLKELNLSNFKTNNVKIMGSMFERCSLLNKLNLTNFNTDNVTDMSYMFAGCSSLKELNIYKFNTSNVNNMSYMFYECTSLEELNISNFNIENVADMSWMFFKCISLKELFIKNFITNNVKSINYMFYGCSNELKTKIVAQYKDIRKEVFVG